MRSTQDRDIAVRPRSQVRVGDTVEVVVDTERMHFFDPETGNAIRY